MTEGIEADTLSLIWNPTEALPMSSRVLRQLEHAMLRELGDNRRPKLARKLSNRGWVFTGEGPYGERAILGWTFGETRRESIETLLGIAMRWTVFPKHASRVNQMAWLRRNGFRAEKAEIRTLE